MRAYQPTTLLDLAAALAAGELPLDADVVVSEGDGETEEYAALMTAADLSAVRVASLGTGLRRRVVVVVDTDAGVVAAEGTVPLRDLAAVHADPVDDADAEEDLAWYAAQEVDDLVAGLRD